MVVVDIKMCLCLYGDGVVGVGVGDWLGEAYGGVGVVWEVWSCEAPPYPN